MSATNQLPELPGLGDQPGAAGEQNFVVARTPTGKVDRWIDAGSDWMSSILVKETRQAIKSRQFFITLILLVLAAIVCAFYALSPGRSDYNEASLGAVMMCGFLWILAVPLVLIIPFSTYRSLSREFDDGTIGVVLITTMKPWQIAAGKLGSAMLQMLLYLSVIAPCITFCYLLRGLSVQQIVIGLCGAVTVCFALNCLALALASLSSDRRFSGLMSVVLIGLQLMLAWFWCLGAYGLCHEASELNQPVASVSLAGSFFLFVSTGVLLFVATAAQLSFQTSNRTSAIRVAVLIQVVLFVAWYVAISNVIGIQNEGFMVASVFAHSYLLLVGSMMVGCASGLSERVRRTLPTTFVGRSFGSLLLPGPGRGWLFTAGAGIALSLAFAVIGIFNESLTSIDSSMNRFGGGAGTFSSTDLELSMATIYTNLIYFLFYLSLVFLLSRVMFRFRKDKQPYVVETGLLTVVMIVLVCIISYSLDSYFNGFRYNSGTSMMHLFNWYHIQAVAGTRGIGSCIGQVAMMSVLTVILVLASFPIAAKELTERSAMLPERNRLDDEENARQNQIKHYDDETIDEIFAAKRPGQEA